MKKLLLLMLVIVVAATVLVGCSFSKSDKEVLRWGLQDDPESMDPQKMWSSYTLNIADQIYEGLCSVDAKNQVIAAGAEKWEISADKLIYTFHLRKNAKWSNGESVTAYDYEYSWLKGVDPKYGATASAMLYFVKNAEKYNQGSCAENEVGVKAIDANTLRVVLERPCEFFLRLMAYHSYFPINKNNALKNSGWAANVGTIICNGPFAVRDWDHNAKITLSANDNYWDKANVKLKKIEIYMVDKDSTAMSMIENGQLDICDTMPPETEYKRLKDAGILHAYPYMNTNYLAFNIHKKPLSDARVRKALAYAINYPALLKESKASGATREAYAWVPYGIPDSAPNSDFRDVGGVYFKYNPELAQKLLSEAGYPNGNGFPELVFLFGGSSGKSKYGEMIQEMYKKTLGINIKLVGQEAKVYDQSRDNMQFDICTNSWVGDYIDPMTYMAVLVSESANAAKSNNVPKYSNRRYDELIERAQNSSDNTERMKLMHEAEAIIFEDMPIAPYAFSLNRVMETKSVHGVVRDASGKALMKEAFKE